MASMKFEEAVALRDRCGGATNRRDDHKCDGGVLPGASKVWFGIGRLQQKHFLKRQQRNKSN
jgi:hypothetical protein